MRAVWWLVAMAACTSSTTDTVGLDGNPEPDTTDIGDGLTSGSTGSTSSTGTPDRRCEKGPESTGPWKGHPIAGATVTSDDYENDAGLAAVRKAALAAKTETVVSLKVTDATVISKGYVPANGTYAKFWVADSSGPLVIYNVDLPDAPGLAPGDVVSFTATKVLNYFDLAEVTEIADFSVSKAPGPVQIIAANTTPIDYTQHGERVVEAYGELVNSTGGCGGSFVCFDMTVGKQTFQFRTRSNFDQVGDCIHFIGPLQRFQDTLQLTVEDFDWSRFY